MKITNETLAAAKGDALVKLRTALQSARTANSVLDSLGGQIGRLRAQPASRYDVLAGVGLDVSMFDQLDEVRRTVDGLIVEYGEDSTCEIKNDDVSFASLRSGVAAVDALLDPLRRHAPRAKK